MLRATLGELVRGSRVTVQAGATLVVAMIVLVSASAAMADVQPMAIGPQSLGPLRPGDSLDVAAYCLEYHSDLPPETTALTHVAAGNARVCVEGERCIPLQTALSRQLVRITGTDDFGVHIEDLGTGSKQLEIVFDNNTVLTDRVRRVAPPRESLPTEHLEDVQIAQWLERGQIVVDEVSVRAVAGTFEVDAFADGLHVGSHQGVKEGNIGATIARLTSNTPASLMISTAGMDEGRMRAMLADLRIRTGSTRRTVVSESFFAEPRTNVSVHAGETISQPVAREIHGEFTLASDRGAIPARIVVAFDRNETPSLFARVGNAMKQALARFRSKGRQPLNTVATSMRDAVAAEVEVLRQNMRGVSRANVWLILGDAARGFYIVKVDLRDRSWEA